MEERHRDIITTCIEQLVAKTSDIGLEMLVNYLVRDGVFTEPMTQKYMNSNESPVMRKTMFFMDVQTRGPQAFDKFISALEEAGATDLSSLLQCTPRRASVHAVQARTLGALPSDLPNYMLEGSDNLAHNLQNLAMVYPDAVVNFSTEPLAVNVKLADERLDLKGGSRAKIPHYHVGSRPKGLALIINIREFQEQIFPLREGAEIDGQNMEALFTALGYPTEIHYDLRSSEMKDVIRKFAARREHTRVHSCMVCIMSHGTMIDSTTDLSTVIYAADGIPVKYVEIIERFNSENCPGLINKPKVFFFQACRGSDRNHGIRMVNNRPRTQTDGFGSIPVRCLSDVLIAHATPRGYEAVRDRFTGSWFIQTLVKVFMENAWDTEVADMLDMVDNQMRHLVSEDNGLQTTCVEKVGFKKFYLSPGLYDEPEPEEGARAHP